MCQRVPGVCITAVLGDDDIGSEKGQYRRQHSVHRLDIGIVLGKRLQWHIHGIAAPATIAQFKHIACAGEKIAARLMKRDSHHTWVIIERALDAIAMMGVEVDIENLGLAGAQHMSNSHRGIVVDAEARRTLRPGMMESTRGMKYVQGSLLLTGKAAAFGQAHHGAHRNQGTTSDTRRDVVYAGQRGCIAIAATVMQGELCPLLTLLFTHTWTFRLAEALNGGNVFGCMCQAYLLRCSGTQAQGCLFVTGLP